MKPAEPFDTLPGPVQETINAHAKYYAKHHNLGMSIRDDMTYVAKVALRWRSALPAESAPLTEEAASRSSTVAPMVYWSERDGNGEWQHRRCSVEDAGELLTKALSAIGEPR